MSGTDLEPLAPDVLEALHAERQRPDLAPDLRLALSERIRLALAASAVVPAPGEPPASSPGAPAVGSGVGVKLGLALFAAGAVTGGIVGAALHAALTAPREQPPTPVVVAPALPPPAPEPTPVEAKRPTPKTPSAPRPQVDPAADVELAKERALLEVAQTALARGNAAEALNTVDRHAIQFKAGRLAEERESLAVQALLALGREADARRRADDFRREFPESMLLPLIDSLVPHTK